MVRPLFVAVSLCAALFAYMPAFSHQTPSDKPEGKRRELQNATIPKEAPPPGNKQPVLSARIVDGQVAAKGDIRYFALVHKPPFDDSSYCGGALIHARWVVTAAQCVERSQGVKVILGTVELAVTSQTATILTADKIYIHPLYSSGESIPVNDIAMLHLPSAVVETENIRKIGLPFGPQFANAGQGSLTMSGFGRTNETAATGPTTNQLHKMITFRSPKYECERYFRDSEKVGGLMCTRDPNAPNRKATQGDTGGPLVDVQRNVLIGIYIHTKYTEPHPEPHNYNIFIEIRQYDNFIKAFLEDMNICPRMCHTISTRA